MKRVIICLVFALLILQSGLARTVTKEEHRELTRRWGIALSAILSHCNRSNLETLELGEINEESIKQWKGVLSDWWGIESRKELLDMLKWLYNEGHSKSYDNYVNLLQKNPGLTANELAKKYALKERESKRLIYVESAIKKENKGSLTGWDLGRYVSICRWGYHSGYLSEQEAYRYIAKAAAKVRSTFSSWDEFGLNYIKGRIFWAVNRDDVNQYITESIGAYKTLTFNELALWRRIPWDLPVKYSKSLDLEYEKIVKMHSREMSDYYKKKLAKAFSADHLLLRDVALTDDGQLKVRVLCGKAESKKVRLNIEIAAAGESKPIIESHRFITGSRQEEEIVLDIPEGVDLESGSFRVKMALLAKASANSSPTALLDEVLFSQKRGKRERDKRLKRVVRYSSEGKVENYREYSDFTAQGEPAKETFYKGSGPDGNWFTEDDEVSTFYINSFNDKGQAVKEESYVGEELQTVRESFFDDEGELIYSTFSYKGSLSLTIYSRNSEGKMVASYRYTDAGRDGKWRTADDQLSSIGRYSLDEKGNTMAYLWYDNIGKDGILGTDDDDEVLYNYFIYHRNSEGKVLCNFNFFNVGEDGSWQTGDDLLEYFERNEFDEEGYIVGRVKYVGAGEDGIIMTGDDIEGGKTLYLYE